MKDCQLVCVCWVYILCVAMTVSCVSVSVSVCLRVLFYTLSVNGRFPMYDERW